MSEIPPPTPGPNSPLDYLNPSTVGAYNGPPPDANAKTWGMLAHLSALVQLLGVPTLVGPLVVWLIKKNEIPFVDHQGKEALNFHITVFIVALCISPTICLMGLGIFLLMGLALAALIFSVIAAMKANDGIAYRYPFTLRLIK